MTPKTVRLVALLVVVCFFQLACYNSFRISNDELANLTSGNLAHRVELQIAGEPVEVRATTPIQVLTSQGERHNISPFNFSFDHNGLVAPDYDLLLRPDEVDGARVFQFAKGRTIGLIVGAVVVAGGGFAAMSILADDSKQ